MTDALAETRLTPSSSADEPSFTTAPRAWDAGRILRWIVAAACIAALFGAGLGVRRWVWRESSPVRFKWDLKNAMQWGMAVNTDGRPAAPPTAAAPTADAPAPRAPTWPEFWRGYRGAYDRYADGSGATAGGIGLDYAPLRLLVMSLWVRSILAADPTATVWTDAQLSPLLWLNVLCAFATAAGAYRLVQLWVRRQRDRWRVPPERRRAEWLRPALAATLVWFNVALLVDAHAWPQWDVWCLPFFVWACCCASTNRWFSAGLLLLLGAMLKTQLLLAAPVLLVWSVFAPRGLPSAARLLLGFFFGAALLGSPWLLPPTPLAWSVCLGIILATAALLAWTLSRTGWHKWPGAGLTLAAVTTVTIFAGCYLFGGSLNWVRVATTAAVERRDEMSFMASGMPEILSSQYAWKLDDKALDVAWPRLGLPDGVTVRVGLRLLYALTLLLAGFAAAVQARRGSARVLLALAAPWVLFYAILPQMFDRYLVWGAVLTAIAVGLGKGMLLPHLVITLVAASATLLRLFAHAPNHPFARTESFVKGFAPGAGWIVLLLGLLYLYQACKLDPRPKPLSPADATPA